MGATELEWLGTLVRNFGGPGAGVIALLWGYHKGWFVSGREMQRIDRDWKAQVDLVMANHSEVIAELKKQMATDRADYLDSLNRIRTEKDYWRDFGIRGLDVAKVATDQAAKSAAAGGSH